MSRDWKEAYPRPQLVRDDWMSLDGEWSFSIKKADEPGMPSQIGMIKVPFCPESELSGIRKCIFKDDRMLYGRSFEVPEGWEGKRLILHFGAVDQTAKVYVDGKYAGMHEGGYLPFSFDITDLLKHPETEKAGASADGGTKASTAANDGGTKGSGTEDESAKAAGTAEDPDAKDQAEEPRRELHSIIVEARDSLDHKYPWGKQKFRNGGMWYTPVSGIWQSVWLEPVPEEHIASLKIDTTKESVSIKAFGVTGGTLELGGKTYELADSSEDGKPSASVSIEIEEPRLWSPEDPHLYEFSITSGSDSIRSYFALRTVTAEQKGGYPKLCLNGKAYFFNGVLDQGYWHDGIYTPSSPDKFAEDILAMKALGFNTLRKHIKIEPEIFYYECDRLGMVVFQDMVNNADYSFFRDTALPTIGLKKVDDSKMNTDLASRRIFRESMEKTVEHLYNHPSICYWTIFNEGWGQFNADEMYEKLKELDSSRIVDSTSGWFWQNKSDVDSYHVYFRKANMQTGSRPMVLSEFGGYACKIPTNYYGGRLEYGYRKCADTDALQRDIKKLYEEEIEKLKTEIEQDEAWINRTADI